MSSICASSSFCRSSALFSRQALLPTIALLSLQGGMANYKSDASREESCSNPNVNSEDVPSRISHLVTDVLKVYSTKNVEEQTAIVNKYYHPEHSSFVDPLMKVDTPREINLAFLSLIKLFKDIQVDQKSVALNPKPRLPSHLKAANTQQYIVHNQQIYHLERSNAIARCLLPGTVDLDVNTYLTIDPQSGKIMYHEDVWNNKSFGFPGFAKQPNGVLSSWIFKAVGWGKEVDKAKFKASQ